MSLALHSIMKQYFRWRQHRINYMMQYPIAAQQAVFKKLIAQHHHTIWGKRYGYADIKSYYEFTKRLPVQDYEAHQPYIDRMMMGEPDVLCNGLVKWFSKSSGTTNDKSKYIPAPTINLRNCHMKGNWDTSTLLYNQYGVPLFDGKSLIMGGSLATYAPHPQTTIGDISAIMLHNFPLIGRPFVTPDVPTALMSNWEEKIEVMAQKVSQEKDLVLIGGVPTWTVVLFRRILALTGEKDLSAVFPRLQVYAHGGVGFQPYVQQFRQLIPNPDFRYLNVYNATEGYFAAQDVPGTDDMLLYVANDMYYEFLPMQEWHQAEPKAIPLEEVKTDVDYALVISTSAGLWRYLVGDTVRFTSTHPYRIQVTGRTKQFINTFGEEVMVANTDKAILLTCTQTGAVVADYTVAPVYFDEHGKGGHEWLIEFDAPPPHIEEFAILLDKNLQQLNSDYEAKRYNDLAMQRLQIRMMPTGSFHTWLKAKGKYGGQHKVPRLANHRKYVEEITMYLSNR